MIKYMDINIIINELIEIRNKYGNNIKVYSSDTEVAKYTFVIKGKNALVEFEFTDDIEKV